VIPEHRTSDFQTEEHWLAVVKPGKLCQQIVIIIWCRNSV